MSNRYLTITHAKPGMILADGVLDKQGHILLPAGVTLTESLIKSLTQHHINTLSVQAADIAPDEEAELRASRIARLEQIARKAPYAEPTQTLLSYLVHYRTGSAS
jgi:hypothetical protein